MKNIESYIEEALLGPVACSRDLICDKNCLMLGAANIYKVIGNVKYKNLIAKYVDIKINEKINLDEKCRCLLDYNYGKVLIFLYDEFKSEKYKKILEEVYSTLIIELNKNDIKTSLYEKIKKLYIVESFFVEYETRFNGKAGYKDSLKRFRDVRDEIMEQKSLIFQEKIVDFYIMALIETLEKMSEEIFEYYREIQLMLKEAIKIKYKDKIKMTEMESYFLLKGIRLGFLDEKYFENSKKIVEGIITDKNRELNCDLIMMYSEYLYL